jgi:hypothetical protein
VAVVLPGKLAEAVAAERKILDTWVPTDPDRPLYTAIRGAFIERFAGYYVLMLENTSVSPHKRHSVPRKKPSEVAAEINRLDRESTRLTEMLFPAVNLPAVGRAREWAAQLGVRNWRDPGIVKFLRRDLRRWGTRRGRPATLQSFGLRALELRLRDRQKWSWNALARELCNCSSPEHGFRCRENLRREVLLLTKSLRALGVKLPAGK